eukprot:1683923-Pyramimonas_sp.AAC.1
MMLGNACPGEEGRAAEVAQGKDPPRSQQQKTVQRTAQGEARLAFQLLQKSTRTPSLEPNFMAPNWARSSGSKPTGQEQTQQPQLLIV